MEWHAEGTLGAGMVVRRCALSECGRQITDRQATGRPRRYCQVSCRRRAQYLRDLARKAERSGPARPSRAEGRAEVSEGRRPFGQALTNLFRDSGLPVRDVARLTRIVTEAGRAAGEESAPPWRGDVQEQTEFLDDWERVSQLVERCGVSAERFRPLWDMARRAALRDLDRDHVGEGTTPGAS
ncbi:hypothetical protein MHW47_05110 [Streptomyces sp. OfavH-34-F]|uniref:hypothetical protein n=1 Tax=Streptomyces sp. OfavH-34-F TaxID=2917760 RepID=UPI001EF24F8E|nr:hypothetical protein [Streptomyces sp. OfavH-34-F]MCG7523827.1 hypothetical protein [Streptomyces sp. OfavH-34-F]